MLPPPKQAPKREPWAGPPMRWPLNGGTWARNAGKHGGPDGGGGRVLRSTVH